MAHRKWNETKQQPSLLPGPAVPVCSLVSFHFLWAMTPQAVHCIAADFETAVTTPKYLITFDKVCPHVMKSDLQRPFRHCKNCVNKD